MLASTLYVRISADTMHVRHLESGVNAEARSHQPFTTERSLVGNFAVAEEHLRTLLRRLKIGGWFRPAPVALVHPLEMTDGGLSEIEERALVELAMGAGARKAQVYVGAALSDDGVRARFG